MGQVQDGDDPLGILFADTQGLEQVDGEVELCGWTSTTVVAAGPPWSTARYPCEPPPPTRGPREDASPRNPDVPAGLATPTTCATRRSESVGTVADGGIKADVSCRVRIEQRPIAPSRAVDDGGGLVGPEPWTNDPSPSRLESPARPRRQRQTPATGRAQRGSEQRGVIHRGRPQLAL